MAIQTYTNLRTRAQEIKNETVEGANTAARVGSLLEDKVDTEEAFENNIAEPDLQQFITGSDGRYIVATLDKRITSNFPAVTTEFRKIHGSRTSPQYNFLSLPASLTTAQKQWLNRVKVVHCGLVVPAVLVPNKPTSPLPVYNGLTNPTSPLATYASQAAMTADFANQVLDSYYYFTGNNGAYKYNGTATDSINNYVRELYMLGDQSAQVETEFYEYTGSTSMWQYNGTPNGLIGDYTELVAVTGWETWGTKPSYLIVQGDAYLTGENNVNELDFVYYELIKIDSVSYADVVVVTNTAHTAMNADTFLNKINIFKIVDNDYNEGIISGEDTIINNSIYTDVEVRLNNVTPADPLNVASYADLGGGNFAIQLIMNPITAASYAGFTTRFIPVAEVINRLLSQYQVLTLFVRFNLPNVNTGDRTLLDNGAVTGATSGCRVRVNASFGFSMAVWRSTGALVAPNSATGLVAEDSNYQSCCFQFRRTETQIIQEAWMLSSDRLYPFTQIINSVVTNADAFLDSGEVMQFDGKSGIGVRSRSEDQRKIFIGKVFTGSEVETVLNLMEGI